MALDDKISEAALYISVDVGTRGVRGAVHNTTGAVIVGPEARVINVYRKEHDVFEQSSTEIWGAICDVIRTLCKDGAVAEKIEGIGFDATCSLVVVGQSDDEFLPVSQPNTKEPSETNAACDIILWADHRALEQAERINKLAEEGKVDLRTVGGRISPEMEPPKLLWLKEHNPKTFQKARHFFDLCDYLTWRATGKPHRSLCSIVCKWQYQVDFTNIEKHGWNPEFWKRIGLDELLENDAERIGQPQRDVAVPGASIPGGLSAKALKEFAGQGRNNLGLREGIAVGVGIIDAHAGGLGMLFCKPADGAADDEIYSRDVTTRIAIIAGTSTCHMASSKNPTFVRGVWGPYGNAMLPHLWLNEAGQSAAGELIDHVINTYCSPAVQKLIPSHAGNAGVAAFLNEYLTKKFSNDIARLTMSTKSVLIYPDFHGNRSPFADPNATGIITGLRLIDVNDADGALDRLALMYLATIQSLAYETRKILDEMTTQGYEFSAVCMGGGLSKNWLYVQSHADVLNLPILLSDTEPMLLGSACLAAAAADAMRGKVNTLSDVCKRMAGKAKIVRPFGYADQCDEIAVNFKKQDSGDSKSVPFEKKLKLYHEKRYELTMNYLRDVDLHVRLELGKLAV